MTARIDNTVIECPDPEALAGFYATLLDMQVMRPPPDRHNAVASPRVK